VCRPVSFLLVHSSVHAQRRKLKTKNKFRALTRMRAGQFAFGSFSFALLFRLFVCRLLLTWWVVVSCMGGVFREEIPNILLCFQAFTRSHKRGINMG